MIRFTRRFRFVAMAAAAVVLAALATARVAGIYYFARPEKAPEASIASYTVSIHCRSRGMQVLIIDDDAFVLPPEYVDQVEPIIRVYRRHQKNMLIIDALQASLAASDKASFLPQLDGYRSQGQRVASSVFVPFVLMDCGIGVSLGTIVTLAIVGWRERVRRRSMNGECKECGYSLAFLPTDRCPECGAHFVDETSAPAEQKP